MSTYVFIYVTFPEKKVARAIAKSLLEEKLIACANILPEAESIYHWQGEIKNIAETPVLFKTTAAHFDAIKKYISKHHPYECPCIIALPVLAGNTAFLEWITQETKVG